MNSFLLDTHVLLWAMYKSEMLSEGTKDIITCPENDIYFSAASLWEIAIKSGKGLKGFDFSSEHVHEDAVKSGFLPLDMASRHVFAIESIRGLDSCGNHNDPFDMMLMGQAKSDDMFLLTRDRKILQYAEPYVIGV